MNLQTVNDLIEELQRLPEGTRKRPVQLGVDALLGAAIQVEDRGGFTALCQGGILTCPQCEHEFEV